MSEPFFGAPILNSPYVRPTRHWELNKDGIPTQKEMDGRRESRLITPIPKPKKRGGKEEQRALEFEAQGVTAGSNQQYTDTLQANSICTLVDEWRQVPESQWKVTEVTGILLTEVAPEIGKRGTPESIGAHNPCHRATP